MPRPRPRLAWLAVTALLFVAGTIAGLLLSRKNPHHTPVAAYLLPLNADTRVKLSWWPARKLDRPLALHADELASIPNDASVRLIHASTGQSEIINGPAKIRLQQKLPNENDPFTSPFEEVVTRAKTIVLPPTPPVIFTSPVGVTRYLNPLITWEAAAGKTYDVAIIDPADPYIPPRIAKNVRPPVAVSALETVQRRHLAFDRNYEIVIRESSDGKDIEGHARFLTLPDARLENEVPTTSADLIAEACAAMAKKPYRTGDAWLALSRLPIDWTKSELGVRLRLRVAAELASTSEIASANADAAQLLRSR